MCVLLDCGGLLRLCHRVLHRGLLLRAGRGLRGRLLRSLRSRVGLTRDLLPGVLLRILAGYFIHQYFSSSRSVELRPIRNRSTVTPAVSTLVATTLV